jgi:hypothetical protein
MSFRQINPPKMPWWHEQRSKPTRGFHRYGLALLSLLILALGAWPPSNGYDEPISLQVWREEPRAILMFIFMGVLLLYTATRLWKYERYFSSLFCFGSVAGLFFIATTNPFSDAHLTMFIFLLFFSVTWIWFLYAELFDVKLLVCALAAMLSVLYCIASLGMGERTFILSTLAGINVLYYEHVLY